MRREHLAAWAPHCPVCARARPGDAPRLPPLLLADGAAERDDDVRSGTLVCPDPSCRHEFPVIDGIPLITPALRQLLGERAVELLLRDDLDPAALSLLGDAIGPDTWFDVGRAALSTYGWDAYADLDPEEPPPPPGAPRPGAARRCLQALLRLAGPAPAPTRVLDLGCAAGRTAFDCAEAAPDALVLGLDGNLSLLRLARAVATGGAVSFPRRRIGLAFDQRRFPADLPGRRRVDFWACDAAALPFAPGSADLVLALNLLDCVPDPAGLLGAMATALRPGGRLLLSTPFDWAARATPVAGWIGGHSQRGEFAGAAEPLLALLLNGEHERSPPGLRLVATGEADWHTRLHDRAAVQYRSHLAVARRDPDGENPAGQAIVTE